MIFSKKFSNADQKRMLEGIAAYIDRHFTGEVSYFGTEPDCRTEVSELLQMPQPVRAPMAAAKACSLKEMLQQEDAGFTETLLKRIDESGRKDSAIYKKAHLSKQHFSKIRCNPDYKPTKPTAIALALALELDLEQTRDLIGRAGYALSNSSKFDLIIRYFIQQQNYDITQINMALYEFDQELLGN